MSEEVVTLRDAVAAYNVQLDLVLKLFAILQAVSLAVSGFMWTNEHHPPQLFVLLFFTLFAIGNAVLIYRAYLTGWTTAQCIDDYTGQHERNIPEELRSVLQYVKNYQAWHLAVIHIFTDAVTIIAILAAPCR